MGYSVRRIPDPGWIPLLLHWRVISADQTGRLRPGRALRPASFHHGFIAGRAVCDHRGSCRREMLGGQGTRVLAISASATGPNILTGKKKVHAKGNPFPVKSLSSGVSCPGRNDAAHKAFRIVGQILFGNHPRILPPAYGGCRIASFPSCSRKTHKRDHMQQLL